MTRRAPLSLLAPVAGALLVVSLRYEMWLLVAAITAAVAVFARRHLQDHHHWLPALLAVRSVAPTTPDPSNDPADPVAAELAVLAKGRLRVLDRAADLAHQETDPHRWSVSISHITIAHDLVRRAGLPGISPAPTVSGWRLLLWGIAAAAAFLFAALTSSAWSPIPLLATYAGVVTVWTDWHEQHRLQPALVAAAARLEPPPPALAAADDLIAVQLAHPRPRARRHPEMRPTPGAPMAGPRRAQAARVTPTGHGHSPARSQRHSPGHNSKPRRRLGGDRAEHRGGLAAGHALKGARDEPLGQPHGRRALGSPELMLDAFRRHVAGTGATSPRRLEENDRTIAQGASSSAPAPPWPA